MKSDKQRKHLEKLVSMKRDRGYWHSSDTIRKISESNIGKKAWNAGKTNIYSEETKSKMGKGRVGMKPHNWKGGSWIYWRREIIKRDGYCVVCKYDDIRILEVAHINPIAGLKNRIRPGNPLNTYDNLITLCPNCHKKLDLGIIKKQNIKKYAKKP